MRLKNKIVEVAEKKNEIFMMKESILDQIKKQLASYIFLWELGDKQGKRLVVLSSVDW